MSSHILQIHLALPCPTLRSRHLLYKGHVESRSMSLQLSSFDGVVMVHIRGISYGTFMHKYLTELMYANEPSSAHCSDMSAFRRLILS